MFKFIRQYAESIRGIDIYPIISLFIFLVFFIAVIWYVRKMDTNHVKEISAMPLEDDDMIMVNTLKQV